MKASKITPLLRFCTLHFTFYISLALPASAQTGNCPRAEGEAYLDAGDVRARILNNGALFYRGEPHVYEVPKGSGKNAIFAGGIWIAGLIDGQLRGAATRYGEWEYWPGPIDEAGNPPADCSLYDRIWEIRRNDIENYLQTGEISINLSEWPWQLGAPVIDGDDDPSNYNLAGGDLPELLGDQRLWWIMNDRGNVHQSSNGEPMGLEVHGSAFAFAHPGDIGYQTFYLYRLINKNTAPLTEAYFSIFADVDLGDFADDYVGSDSLLHLGYAYNSDNEDTGGEGYGTGPPAIGFTFLKTPVNDTDGLDNDRDGTIDEAGEMIGASSVLEYGKSGSVRGDPLHIEDYYNYMQTRWKDGQPLMMGWDGYAGSLSGWPADFPRIRTRFSLSGDPTTGSFWSEFNMDNKGTQRSAGDRRVMTTTGPFDLVSNEALDIAFAIVWSQGKDHLDSVTELKKDVASIRTSRGAFYTPVNVTLPPAFFPHQNFPLGFDQNHPNPFTESTTLRYSLPEPLPVRLSVYDVLGREVAVLVDEAQEPGIYSVDFDARGLPAGLYIARIQMGFLQYTKRMVKR